MSTADMSLTVLNLLKGLDTINLFIEAAEGSLYDVDDIENRDTESLLKLYESASRRQIQVLETSRKILNQMKGKDDSDWDSDIMSLASMLKGLTVEQIEQLSLTMKGRLH